MRRSIIRRWRQFTILIGIVSLSVLGAACSGGPDDEEVDNDKDPNQSELNVRVLEVGGDPIEDASVMVGDQAADTSQDGSVSFELAAGQWRPRVDAEGYAAGAREIDLPADISLERTIHLMPMGDPHEFDASTESDVFENRVRLSIPGGALQDADGNDYTGTAQAHIAPLNPSTDEDAAMPTPLSGILEGDEEPTPMESMFMADIELTTDDGEPLSLKDGSQATLEFVLPDDLQEDYSSGDQIEAYFFDEAAGIWKQDGMGEVIESTYAAGKLAWEVDVDHFTWWNCDAPWTDKNCVQVEVVGQSSGDPVEYAQVYADGVSYNGTTSGSTGSIGEACVNFKKNSTVELKAQRPLGLSTVSSNVTQISGSSTAATCDGQGSGNCQQVQVTVPEPTCLSGRVVDDSGSPVDGADVTGRFSGPNGTATAHADTDSNGEYCLKVPRQAQVDVSASYFESGTFRSTSTQVTASGSASSCGGGSCTSVSDLNPQPSASGCIDGDVLVNRGTANPSPAAAGTNVYMFAGTSELVIDCSKPPSQWGDLLSQAVTDGNGEYCLNAPVGAEQLIAVAGKCNSSASDPKSCINEQPVGVGVSQAASCGSGNCVQPQESVYLRDTCGEGP